MQYRLKSTLRIIAACLRAISMATLGKSCLLFVLTLYTLAATAENLKAPQIHLASSSGLTTLKTEAVISNLFENAYFKQKSGGQYFSADGNHFLVTMSGTAIALGKWGTKKRAGQVLMCETESTGYYQENGVTKAQQLDPTCFLVSVASGGKVILTTNQESYPLGKPSRNGFKIEKKFNRLRLKFGV
ncbi:MAG: hypothetical protein ACI84R_003833 [Candidatus Azotimanducaceae bacterium]|jgi:hypothetical protein